MLFWLPGLTGKTDSVLYVEIKDFMYFATVIGFSVSEPGENGRKALKGPI